ncbi:MAG: acyltransferase family protein [Eubacteriales bacterium]
MKEKIKSFWLSNSINAIEDKPRIDSYDVMRGLAVVFMILIHVVHTYARGYNEDSVIGYIIEFTGGPPAAPTFMMLMGIFFIYSNKASLRKSIFRGLNILLIAFVLNLVRGIIPYYVLTEIQGVPLDTLGEYFRMEFLIFEVDILTFAGFAYMIMALIYHYIKKPIVWAAIAAAIAVFSPLLWKIEVTQLPLQYLVNAFWGDEYLSTFPLFPWLTFPLVGMIIGKLLLESKDHNKTIKKLALYAIALIPIGVALIFLNTDYFYNAYGKMGIGAIIAIIGFVLFWQLAVTKVYNALSDKINTGFLRFLSKYVMHIYFVHWVICKWGVVFFGIDSMGALGIAITFVSLTILASFITWLYVGLNKRKA